MGAVVPYFVKVMDLYVIEVYQIGMCYFQTRNFVLLVTNKSPQNIQISDTRKSFVHNLKSMQDH